jgi:O104-antigen biosynthesis beta-1,3-galactosyltransferase
VLTKLDLEGIRMTVSVLMPVYAKESPAFLDQALRSIVQQSLRASQVVLVKDGPLGSCLDAVIASFSNSLPLTVIALPENAGCGTATRAGMDVCRQSLIARMDSDDICLPHRLEVQTRALMENPGVDAVGGAIAEFETSPERPVAYRRPPSACADVARWARFRNPINHMTVMFRREAALRAGNFQHFPDFEDYHLWVRMLLAGSRLMNVDQVLVNVRIGNGMHSRRRGLRYALQGVRFQRFLCQSGFISPARAICNATLGTPLRLIPAPMGRFVYMNLLRSR